MPKSKRKTWTIKKIIRKAADINLNTAIALSKSIEDENKAVKRRAKKEVPTPFHLMMEPCQVQKILDNRLSDEILQPFKFNLTNLGLHKKCKLWDKTSLYCDIKPGDLSYNNINLSELNEYYLPVLSSYFYPTSSRVGDNIMSMSLIIGREKSFIFTKNPKEHKLYDVDFMQEDNTSFELFPKEKAITRTSDVSDDNIKVSTTDAISDNVQVTMMDSPASIKIISEYDYHYSNIVKLKSEKEYRFMKMFNNSKHSDLFILLKSGDILYLHKFVLEAWQCDEERMKEAQHFISDIEDDIVIRVFKHLYSDGQIDIDDIIDSKQCLNLCQIFGLDQLSLIKTEKMKFSKESEDIFTNSNSSKSMNFKPPILNNNSFGNLSFIQQEQSIYFKNKISPILNKNVNDINMVSVINKSEISNLVSINNPIQSTPIQACKKSTNNEMNHSSPSSNKLSDSDLFDSISQSSFIMDSHTNDNNSHSDPISNSEKEISKHTHFEVYKKLCVFTNEELHSDPSENVTKVSDTNENIRIKSHTTESEIELTLSNSIINVTSGKTETASSENLSPDFIEHIPQNGFNNFVTETLSCEIVRDINIDVDNNNFSNPEVEDICLSSSSLQQSNLENPLLSEIIEKTDQTKDNNIVVISISSDDESVKNLIKDNILLKYKLFIEYDTSNKLPTKARKFEDLKENENHSSTKSSNNQDTYYKHDCDTSNDHSSSYSALIPSNQNGSQFMTTIHNTKKNDGNQTSKHNTIPQNAFESIKFQSDPCELSSFESPTKQNNNVSLDKEMSPLPLFQRIGLKSQKLQDAQVIKISIDEEMYNTKISQSKQKIRVSNETKTQITKRVSNEKRIKISETKVDKKKRKSEGLSDVTNITPTKRSKDKNVSLYNGNSPLPLSQRIGLKPLKTQDFDVIKISSDEEICHNEISQSKQKTRVSNEKTENQTNFIKGVSGERSKTKTGITKILETKIEKNPRKRKPKDLLDVKTKINYETPPKQKMIFNPFTPMDDFHTMSTPLLQKKCSLYGLKQKLPKKKSIKVLEEIYKYTHQIDASINNSSLSSSDSSDGSNDISVHESTANVSENIEIDKIQNDVLNDNVAFYNFIKSTYYLDIIMFKPLDIKKVLSELKINGINTTLKQLNDYFDNQCIACINNDEKKSRPMKASKMIL